MSEKTTKPDGTANSATDKTNPAMPSAKAAAKAEEIIASTKRGGGKTVIGFAVAGTLIAGIVFMAMHRTEMPRTATTHERAANDMPTTKPKVSASRVDESVRKAAAAKSLVHVTAVPVYARHVASATTCTIPFTYPGLTPNAIATVPRNADDTCPSETELLSLIETDPSLPVATHLADGTTLCNRIVSGVDKSTSKTMHRIHTEPCAESTAR